MSAAPPNITSRDIDPEKYSFDKLVAMRELFPDRPDEELARYLIARNDDLEKAAAQLRKALEWRAANFPIMKADCGEEFTAGKLMMNGFDREGRPILFWNARLNFNATRDMDKLAKTMFWWTEYTIRQLPPQFSKFTLIMDRVGFTRENADMDFAKFVTSALQVSRSWRNSMSSVFLITFTLVGRLPRESIPDHHLPRGFPILHYLEYWQMVPRSCHAE